MEIGLSIILVSGSLLMSALVAQAHGPPVHHECQAPVRPIDKTDVQVWNQFVDKVDVFRACINSFTIKNHAASELHRESANSATEDWNQFVHGSLNAPEDYPWPPEEKINAE